MADDIIKSFLVGLGFKIDEAGLKKFDTQLKSVHETVKGFAIGFGVLAIGIEEAIRRVGRNFEQLFFLSAQIGTSANNLKSMQFGFSQVGIGADAFAASLSSLNKLILDSPGMRHYIHNWIPSFNAQTGTAEQALEGLIDSYAKILEMPEGAEKQAAESRERAIDEELGQNTAVIRQLAMFNKDRKHWQEEDAKLLKLYGLNAKEAAEQAHKMMDEFNFAGRQLNLGFERLAVSVMPAVEIVMRHFSEWFAKNIIPDIDNFSKSVENWFKDPENVRKFNHALDCVAEAAKELVQDIKIVIGWFVALQKEIGTTGTVLVAVFSFSIAKALAASITSNLVALVFAPLISGAGAAGASAGGAFAGAFAVAIPALILGSLGFLESWISERFGVPNPAERRREEIKLSAGHKPGEEQSDYSKKTGMREGGPADRLWKWLFSSSGAGQPADRASRPHQYSGPPIGGNQSLIETMVFGFQHWWAGSGNFSPRIDFVDGIYSKIADMLRDVFGLQPGGSSNKPGGGAEGGGGATTTHPGGRFGSMGPSRISVGDVPEATKASVRELSKFAQEKLGLDQAHTEAMLASALVESGVNPAGRRGAAGEEGMFQWLGSRWTNLQKSLGDKQRNPFAQFEYALKEMDTIDPGWRTRQADSRTLSGQWVSRFERPKNPSDRYGAVQQIQNMLRTKEPENVHRVATQKEPENVHGAIQAAIGDSIAVGVADALKVPRDAIGGTTPEQIYDRVSKHVSDFAGKNVALASGSNPNRGYDQRQMEYVHKTLETLYKAGAHVALLGVGHGVKDAAKINKQLGEYAREFGAPFTGELEGTQRRGGVVHPDDYRKTVGQLQRHVAIDSDHTVTINLHGVTSPTKTAEAVEEIQRRHSLVHARNLRTAIA